MSNTVEVINTKNGKVGRYPKHLLDSAENLELYVPEVVSLEEDKAVDVEEVVVEEADMSYKAMKQLAKELGHEVKGNIKKSELKELLEL